MWRKLGTVEELKVFLAKAMGPMDINLCGM